MNRLSQKYKKETRKNPCKKFWFGLKFYTKEYVGWLEKIARLSLKPEKVSSVEQTGFVNNSILRCEEPLKLLEKEVIEKFLVKNNGHRIKTARDLNMSERNLYRKIKQYNL